MDKRMTAMDTRGEPRSPAPVPVTIIGGFLGAGKTTLLNHLLSERHGVRAGVLVNDFGAVNIDAKLVVGVNADTIELANGCVCCSIREDLVSACVDLLRRPDPPEVLIIETSGVSDPAEVVRTFDAPALQPLMTIGNLIAVADAERFPGVQEGEAASLARAQIQAADLILLNKVDLVDGRRLSEVRELLWAIAPRSRLLEGSHGRVPVELMLGTATRSSAARSEASGRTHQPHRHGDHDNADRHPFTTWHWASSQPLSLPKLRAVIEGLPETIYRAKGIVYLEELPPYRIAFQMVGKRYNLRDTEPWGCDSPGSEIVLIAARGGIDTAELQRAFDNCLGTGDETNSPVLRLSRQILTAASASDSPQGENT